MKSVVFCAAALFTMIGPAFADEAIVAPAPGGPAIVEHRSDADVDTNKKVVIKKDEGCSSKTVTKSNDMGDKVSHTKTNC